jgi:4-diphosphocytidyl-2-C-methyl-D-erythritol kinase
MPEALTLRVPCKINLSLEVVGRRPDGYHDLRTVMQAVDLCDELTLAPRGDGRIALTCDDAALPAGEDNLAVRAARVLQERSGARQGADIALLKRIPTGGGLGGGRADAALALLGLDRLWGLSTGRDDLTEMAAALGSDVAFFLHGGTALCEGRGERVRPVPCGGPFSYVLVMPPWSTSTRAVYAALGHRQAQSLTSRRDASTKVLEAVARGDSRLLGKGLHNDLQAAAFGIDGRLGELWGKLEELRQSGESEGCLLSGSGSTFFAVMRGRAQARQAAKRWQSLLQMTCVAVQGLPSWDFDCMVLTTGRAPR